MKRLVLATTGTVTGIAALLGVRFEAHPVTTTGPLPSAGVPVAAAPSAAHTGAGTTPAGPVASRTFTGKAATTQYGIVQVRVTVAGAKITDVAFVQLTAFDQHSQEINSYAGPQLLQQTLTKQTAKVDTVSGASYTSEGYRESAQSALDQAGLR